MSTTPFTVTLFGVGKIGEAIAALLSLSGRYTVRACDEDLNRAQSVAAQWNSVDPYELNLENSDQALKLLEGSHAVISALPYFCNVQVAELALKANTAYFDLTEDVKTTAAIAKLSEHAKTIFMPQCGLAPGFIGILGNHLAKSFDTVESLKLRVGALPMYPTNALRYNLTWSTDGLINEYGNLCEALIDGRSVSTEPLEGYERFILDGEEFEAFNTSGGLGSLCETLHGRVRNLNYKTIRYPGHRDLIAFLMRDLKLNDDRETLKRILENAIPATVEDKCVVFAEAVGRGIHGYQSSTYAKAILSGIVGHKHFTAIQLSTAAGVAAAADLCINGALNGRKGFIRSEDIPFFAFVQNEFGCRYQDA